MSHRHSAWYREAEAQRPLYKVSCHHPGCDYVRLTTDPELTKVHHAASAHYGHPHAFTVVKWHGGDNANG